MPIDAPRRRPARTDSGFTLIELVLVIVLTSILAAVVAMFGNPIRSGVDGQRRAEMADAADTAYRRISRDLRRAVPNSIRLINSQTIEFIPSKDGGRYAYDLAGDTGDSISFENSGDLSFDIVGSLYGSISPGDYIVIGNWGDGQFADAYCPSAAVCNRAEVAGATATTVTLTSNPFASPGGPGPDVSSPGQRFQVVDGTEQAVTFSCANGELRRYWHYDFGGDYTEGSSAILAKNVTSCDFQYVAFHSQMWGLFRIELTMRHPDLSGDAPVQLVYQVHVSNTP